MDRLFQLGSILDARLTTEVLNQAYPPKKILEENRLSASEIQTEHYKLEIWLLEFAEKALEEQGMIPHSHEEVALVCRRVQTFLIARGFLVRKSFQP